MTVDDWHAAMLADADALTAIALAVGVLVALVLGVVLARQVF